MTPEQQRIAIAEACGLKKHEEQIEHNDGYRWTETRRFWVCPKGNRVTIPDYLNDFNAMHEAELTLTTDQRIHQAEWLGACCDELPTKSWVILLRAIVAQRAEAFLRTLNLWKE